MLRNLVLLILLAMLASSCENSTDVTIDLPYKEYTVVEAQLSAYETFKGVRITHTLPLDEPYDINKAEIKDAFAYIVENNIRTYPLHYTQNGMYFANGDFIISPDSKYEFFAQVGDKTIYSKTIVPDKPVIKEASNSDNQYLFARIDAKPGEAYGAAWIIANAYTRADNFFSVETAETFPSELSIRTIKIPSPYNTPQYSDDFFIRVYAFDKAYKDYFITSPKGSSIDNVFISGGGSVLWNVYGRDVIGLFIGVTKGDAVQP